MRRVDRSGDCWVWTGAIDPYGYGRIGLGRRGDGVGLTHRVTYEHFIGPISPGLDLDHLCRNRACCNPEHLEPVERIENVARGLRAKGYGEREFTHCKRGHPFTPENTIKTTRQRRCRECVRQRRAKRAGGQAA